MLNISQNVFGQVILVPLTTTLKIKTGLCHCVENVRIRSYSGPYFPAFGLIVRISPNKSEYGDILRSAPSKANDHYFQ